MKNMFTLNEKEKKQIIEMHNNYKKLLNEQEVKQGGQGDPYQYKKEGDEYFYAMKVDGVNPTWKKHTTSKGREAICTKIFGRTPGCGALADTNPKSNDSGPDVDSGVPASAQIAKEGVTPSSFGAKCTKITVIGSFPVRVTSNPANMTKFMENLINGIKTNQITNASYVKGKAVVSGIRLTGGASNRYGGKPVKPEMDNNYNFQKYPDNPAYDPNQFAKNKQLAVNRANGLYDELVKTLPSKGIALSPTLKPQVLSYVVDTGGKVDDTRNTGKYPNPGQIVMVEIDICGVEETSSSTDNTPKDPIGGKIPNNIDEFKKLGRDGFVLTGAYFCNGKNSLNASAQANTFDSCGQVQLQVDKNKKSADSHMSSYEIKYQMNVNGQPYVRPVVRWKIYWNTNNKITKVLQQQVNKEYDPKGIFPSKQIDPNDEFFKLALKSGNPDAPDTRFDKFIKPYL
jgi:hypothetical protein